MKTQLLTVILMLLFITTAFGQSKGNYLILLNKGVPADSVRSDHNTPAKQTLAGANSGYTANLTSAQVADLKADPRVRSVEPNLVLSVSSAQTEANAPWNLDRIDQKTLPLSGTYTYDTASGVNAYVVDTGIFGGNNEFAGKTITGFNALDNSTDITDCNGHGTHVAGIIGGATYGVAKDVNLVGVKVFPCSGFTDVATIYNGLQWILNNGQTPAVVNLSLGGAGNSDALTLAINELEDAGFVVTVAAGNNGANACDFTPSNVTRALVVGASDENDNAASFSNTGQCVDLFAPGLNIQSASYFGQFLTQFMSGTSMSAPHVAGVAAIYLNHNPTATADEVNNFITNQATPNAVKDFNDASVSYPLLFSPEYVVVQTNGTIKIIKDAQPNSPQDFTFTTTGGNSLPSSFLLDDDTDSTLPNNRSWVTLFGTYTVTETPVAGWNNTSIHCTETGGTSDTTVSLVNHKATIKLQVGETVTCTFVNARTTAAYNNVSGSVKSNFGTGLPDATVTATNASGVSWTANTDATGNFAFSQLPADFYIFQVSKTGYIFGGAQGLMVNDAVSGLNFVGTANVPTRKPPTKP